MSNNPIISTADTPEEIIEFIKSKFPNGIPKDYAEELKEALISRFGYCPQI